MEDYKDLGGIIQRLSDGAFIPKDEQNSDYKAYLLWLEKTKDVA